jgi:hypothetical protein
LPADWALYDANVVRAGPFLQKLDDQMASTKPALVRQLLLPFLSGKRNQLMMKNDVTMSSCFLAIVFG